MHIYKKQVLEQYLDLYGHVNHASYLTILEEARWDWVTSKGYGVEYIQKSQMGPVVLEVKIKFVKELVLREWITIESRTKSWDGKIGYVEQKIYKADNTLACEAELKFGLLDLKTRRLISITEDWLLAFS